MGKQSFWKIGLQIKSIEKLKKIFNDDEYINKLTDSDEDLIPFCISRHYAFIKDSPNQASAVLELFDIINSDVAVKINKKFNFGIKELRQLYIYSNITENFTIKYNENIDIHMRENNFLETMFSIRNSHDKKHKIITFMGIKLKIKLKQ